MHEEKKMNMKSVLNCMTVSGWNTLSIVDIASTIPNFVLVVVVTIEMTKNKQFLFLEIGAGIGWFYHPKESVQAPYPHEKNILWVTQYIYSE